METTWPTWTWALPVFLAYMLLCTTLRHHQRMAMEKKFDFPTRASLANMTLDQAYAIQKWLAEQEFPTTFSASLFFALFKVFWLCQSLPAASPTNVA